MSENHIGVKSDTIKTERAHNFQLALSYLEDKQGQGWFVLHVNPGVSVSGGLGPDDLLEMLGFKEYSGICPHLNRPCYSKRIYRLPSKSVGVQLGVGEFDLFVESIQELYSRASDFTTLAAQHADFVRWGKQFSIEPKLLGVEGVEPNWLHQWRVPEHQSILERLEHFQTVEYCLWGTGDALVDSVHYILTDMSLDARKTKTGATVDLILSYPAKDTEIGIEVTGINTAIKKDSNKFDQAYEYIRDSENHCAAVILANTYNDTPLSDRVGLEHFTKDALKIMTRMGIVGLTTMDLYRIWKAVVYDGVDIDTIICEVCDHEGGVYKYPP